MITTAELFKKYGKPSENGVPYLTRLTLPYPMILAWDTKISVKSIQCHQLVAPALKSVFESLLQHYGLQKIQELHINRYGGCFNYRKMRNGNVSRRNRKICSSSIPRPVISVSTTR